MRSWVSFVAVTCVLGSASGCTDRPVEGQASCAVAGVSEVIVPVKGFRDLDLLFVVDGSASMVEERRKLAESLPRLLSPLVTGDLDGDGSIDGPWFESVRIGFLSTDLGVRGIGASAGGSSVPSCAGATAETAEYGDDGRLRLTMTSVHVDPDDPTSPLVTDCDVDGVLGDDVVTPATLPSYLTFPFGASVNPASLAEFGRRGTCFANSGGGACDFAQPLESVLKAITPAELSYGFYAAPGEAATRGVGHGDNPDTNGSWLRDPTRTALGIVIVTDDDDCSASDGAVFDVTSTAHDDPDAVEAWMAGTRCQRFAGLLHDVHRYQWGFTYPAVGVMRPPMLAVLGGVPPDLVDDEDSGEGSNNLDAIVADPRMAYVGESAEVDVGGVPTMVEHVSPRPACTHVPPGRLFTVAGSTVTASNTLVGATVTSAPAEAGAPTVPEVGMRIEGDALPEATRVVRVDGTGPYVLTLSAPATATATGSFGLGQPDTWAAPARRLASFAQALSDAPGLRLAGSLHSICADDFEPAMTRIAIRFMEQVTPRVHWFCLSRPLHRGATGRLSCDVTAVLDDDVACYSIPGFQLLGYVPAPSGSPDADGRRERCHVDQLPVFGADIASQIPPDGYGWFYDDYTSALGSLCEGYVGAWSIPSSPEGVATYRIDCTVPVLDQGLARDINSPCDPADGCPFPTAADAEAFATTYGLPASFTPSVVSVGDPREGSFVCETDTLTCQIACETEADCPPGFACYDDHFDGARPEDPDASICVAAACIAD